MSRQTNRTDAPPGTPLYTATCQGALTGGGTYCRESYEYAREHDGIPADGPSMAAAMCAHLNGHTDWTAVLRPNRSGIDVWCPAHRWEPAALASELRALADEVAATLAPADPLDRIRPGSTTHARLLDARAHALAGLATLATDHRADRRARGPLMTMPSPRRFD